MTNLQKAQTTLSKLTTRRDKLKTVLREIEDRVTKQQGIVAANLVLSQARAGTPTVNPTTSQAAEQDSPQDGPGQSLPTPHTVTVTRLQAAYNWRARALKASEAYPDDTALAQEVTNAKAEVEFALTLHRK